MFYRTCTHCGAHLDPGEQCSCDGHDQPEIDMVKRPVARKKGHIPQGVQFPVLHRKTVEIMGRTVSRFERGVDYYTVALVPIRYPENAVNCRYCPIRQFRLVDWKAAVVCGSTGEIIKDVDNPDDCPAVIQEE